MSARKVPFEKCTRWRKVCGRSAKDQIGDYSIYSFFLRFRAKGSRKARERCVKDVSTRAMSCPKWAAFSHAWYWSKGKEATYHNDILVASTHSCKQQPMYCIVCIRVCLIPYIGFLIRILVFGKCNPYGTAKGGERFAKDLRKGGSWELLFSTSPIYTYLFNLFMFTIHICILGLAYSQYYTYQKRCFRKRICIFRRMTLFCGTVKFQQFFNGKPTNWSLDSWWCWRWVPVPSMFVFMASVKEHIPCFHSFTTNLSWWAHECIWMYKNQYLHLRSIYNYVIHFRFNYLQYIYT